MKKKKTISHVVVEVLLQLLVDKVDGELLEPVVLKHLEACDVQYRTEVGLNKVIKSQNLVHFY